jgi:transcriptional regulator with XRE-family HTH domain
VRIDTDALRRAREAKGYTPSELGRRAGFRSRNYVHRLEDGTRGTNVSAKTLAGLATALEVEPDKLLVAEDDPELSPVATPKGPTGSPTPEPDPHPEAWRWG